MPGLVRTSSAMTAFDSALVKDALATKTCLLRERLRTSSDKASLLGVKVELDGTTLLFQLCALTADRFDFPAHEFLALADPGAISIGLAEHIGLPDAVLDHYTSEDKARINRSRCGRRSRWRLQRSRHEGFAGLEENRPGQDLRIGFDRL